VAAEIRALPDASATLPALEDFLVTSRGSAE
jgi:hypothetical protein